MFAGIYYGGMYGGSTTSILLNTPGESSSIMTALEGNKMAKAGRGAAALGTAAHRLVRGRHDRDPAARPGRPDRWSSWRSCSVRRTTSRWPCWPSWRRRRCSAPRRCAGLAALCLGLFLGLVGTDLLTGQQRFTFGIPQLADGIDVVVVAVGLFAVGRGAARRVPAAARAGRR